MEWFKKRTAASVPATIPGTGYGGLYINSTDNLPHLYDSDAGTDTSLVGITSVGSSDGTIGVTGTAVIDLKRPAVTGNVSIPAGSSVATIGASQLTNAMHANMGALTFKANNTGSAAAPTDISVASAKTMLAIVEADVSGLVADLAAKAPIVSPAFTGVPTTPTAAPGSNSTQVASTAYADAAAAAAAVGLMNYRGLYNASGNVFPTTGGSGAAGAINKGDYWIVSVAGTLGAGAVTPGDLVIALIATPGQTINNWDLVSHDIGYAPENVANKSTDGTLAANSTTLYPSQSAVKTYADTKAIIGRLINTTAPLAGGGDLSADRTLSITATTVSAAGSMSAADKVAVNTTLGKDATGANPTVFRPGDYAATHTYDPTGTANSTSSFSAALAAFIASGGRARFEMAPGVFKVDPAIFTALQAGPGAIKGAGRGVTVLIPTSGSSDFIQLPATGDGWEVGDFAIFNTSGTPFTTNNGINTNGCDDVVIHDMQFVDLFNDINVNSSSIKVSMQRLIHFQTNGSASSVGILVANGAAGDTYIGPDVVMSNTGATRRRACVEIAESGHFEINQCNLTGSQYGTLIDPAAGKIVAFGFINETLNDSCSVAGMRLSASTSTSTIKNIKSTNSWYSGTVAGVGTSGVVTDGVAGGIINGVTFSNDRMLNNQQHGFSHTFGTDFRWADCDMKGNSAQTANTYDGLNVAAAVSNWSVNGGKYGGTDTAVSGNQRYGIFCAAGAGNTIKIAPDDLTGNSTGPWSIGASGLSVFLNGCPGLCPGYFSSLNSTGILTTAAVAAQTPIPKNSLRVGSSFRIKVLWQSSGVGTVSLTPRIAAGTDTIGGTPSGAVIGTATSAAAAAANTYGQAEFIATVTLVGASGSIQVTGGGSQGVTVFNMVTAAHASGAGFLAMDTTADKILEIAMLVSATGASILHATIEVINY